MGKQYAIISFRDTGPLKTWGAIRGAQIHNCREKPIAHAELAIPPIHVIGSGKLVRDVKDGLRKHGLDPHALRKNGVIAYEAVLTASPDFFKNPRPHGDTTNVVQWHSAVKEFLLEKYGEHRVVSLVLHMDEKTPHYHAVILPLSLRADGRSKDPSPRWALVGSTISGPGEFDRLQDEYARAMEPLGLCRGEVKSGRKHKPVKQYLAELKAQEAANQKRAADLEAELARARDTMALAQREREELQKAREKHRAERAEADAKLASERAVLAEDCKHAAEVMDAIDRTIERALRFVNFVERFPEDRWSEQAFGMAQSAKATISAYAAGNIGMQRAWLQQQGGVGR